MSQNAGFAILSTIRNWSIGLGLVGGITQTALFNVDGGERAVMYSRIDGVKEEVRGEGTWFMVPWFEKPIIFDIRTRPTSIPTHTGTKDLQQVNLTLRILTRPKPDKLPTIFSTLGENYDERVLPSITNEVLKAVVAQFEAEELLTQRELVSKKVMHMLEERASAFNIVLEDVAITQLSFSSEFSKAIESKQVAQQEAERATYVVLKSEQERKAAIIRAEGESESARLLSEATKKSGDAILELRRIETAKEVAHAMSRSKNVVYLPSGGNMLLGINP